MTKQYPPQNPLLVLVMYRPDISLNPLLFVYSVDLSWTLSQLTSFEKVPVCIYRVLDRITKEYPFSLPLFHLMIQQFIVQIGIFHRRTACHG